MRRRLGLLVLSALSVMPPGPAAAQSKLAASELTALAFDQHPGARLPLDAVLQDESGRRVHLGAFFIGRPVILVLEYLHCRTLCGIVMGDLAQSLDQIPLDAGGDYEVAAVSIDPRETTADAKWAKEQYRKRYRHAAAAGWHFLIGSAAEVARIAEAVGFPYRYDASIDQYAHPAGITVAAADGTISRYILGIDYRPLDLRLALTEAAAGRISSPAASLLLLCYHYDPAKGRYGVAIHNAMLVAGGLTVLGLATMLVALSRPGRR